MGAASTTVSTDSTHLRSTIKESDLTYHELLGYGGSGGEVYRVTWRSKDQGDVEAAAKKIPIVKGIDEQLANEIKFLQNLNHPNIIKYYGLVVTSHHVVIVTEYAANGSLFDYLKDKTRLPPALKTNWAIQAVEGIKYLKENHVLHRDIKSPNFLITSQHVLKICDFGISKDLTSTKTTTTEKGSIKWQAPEIFKDHKLSPKADIFGFGIMLWELETCEEPYEGEDPSHVMWKVGIEDARPKIPENCPKIFKSLMQHCWDKDRNNRPEVDEIISQLEIYESSLQWHYKHEIEAHIDVSSSHWVSHQHLAVCTEGCVNVYEATTEGSHLAYKLTSAEWIGKYTKGAAVSESMPDNLLVICHGIPYLYQYPCHQATQPVKKFKIQGGQVGPWCIVANANTAVIALYSINTIVVCRLPDFTHQSRVHTSVDPCDLCISTDYLVVMGWREMLVKPLGDPSQDLCRIKPPDGWRFQGVCFRNNARQIYAACRRADKGCVYTYTWKGVGKPQLYVNTGCIIDGLGFKGYEYIIASLSVRSDGLFAASQPSTIVKIYSLE